MQERTVAVASSTSLCHTTADCFRNSFGLTGLPFTRISPTRQPPEMLQARILSCARAPAPLRACLSLRYTVLHVRAGRG